MLFMKGEWGNLNRIRAGPAPPGKAFEAVRWLKENAKAPFFHSDGYECFYFKDRNDAIHFKLRWFDELTGTKTH